MQSAIIKTPDHLISPIFAARYIRYMTERLIKLHIDTQYETYYVSLFLANNLFKKEMFNTFATTSVTYV